jgi:hypothetical protein
MPIPARSAATRTSVAGRSRSPRPDPGPLPVGAWLGRYQACLFFPMLLLDGLHLHIASAPALGRSGKARWAEAGLLAVHIGGYLTAVFVVLSPCGRWCSSFSSRACSGSTWEPRSPQPQRHARCGPGREGRFPAPPGPHLTHNIRGSLLTDLALGGFDYQIEHHLFPSMPRPSLRHAQAPVRRFCAQHGIALHADRPAGLLCAGTAPPPHHWPDGPPGTGC